MGLIHTEKEWSITCYKMEEPWKPVKWKPAEHDHVLCDSINIKYPQQANL